MPLQLLLALALLRFATAETSPTALPGCPSSCGGVSIPYAFGFGPGCFLDGFEITCNGGNPYLGRGNIDVLQINLTQGLIAVKQYIAADCYNADGSLLANNEPSRNFKFSDDRNMFTAAGCDTLGIIQDIGAKLKTGCFFTCSDSAAIINGTCSGIGCCNAPIPRGLRSFQIGVTSLYNHRDSWNFNPCSYAFLADEGWQVFSLSNFTDLRNVTKVPVTLDWVIMDQTCEQTQHNPADTYAWISANSYSVNSTNGSGYLCNCSEGFQGNPYLRGDGGCQDINECEGGESPCVKKCINTDGSYYCSFLCYINEDGKRNRSGCTYILTILYFCIGVGLSILILVVMRSWVHWICKKRMDMKMRQKFFQQNGGSSLQQQIHGGGTGSATRVFSEKELRVATENSKQSRILGKRAMGRVYQGVLSDQTVVTVKRSKITDGVGMEQFNLRMLCRLRLVAIHLLFVIDAQPSAAAPPSVEPIARPNCQSKCGNVSIPYPFGIGRDCFRPDFEITCKDGTPYLGKTDITVVDIQPPKGLLVINGDVANDCYDQDSNGWGFSTSRKNRSIDLQELQLKPYWFSNVHNKFIGVGCDTKAYLWNENFWGGCLSFCKNKTDVNNGTCSGVGCCTSTIPKGLQAFKVDVFSYFNHSYCMDFDHCSYGALVTESWLNRLNFSVASFSQLGLVDKVPVAMDWAIPDSNCAQANRSPRSECVSQNSYCVDSQSGAGYFCRCADGFQGNPYLHGGCADINECEDPLISPCVLRCTNADGWYTCSCPWYMYGDGNKAGSGCKSVLKELYLGLGVALTLLFLILAASWIYWIIKKNKLELERQKFFRQNGGVLLQQDLDGSRQLATTLFSSEELRLATGGYSQSRILGQGGAGTVYKGIMPNQTIVAVKKSKITNAGNDEIEQFINEVVILSDINHRNVVKLLGCCLETEVPMLVYEFVSNGTLAYHIHDESCKGSLPFLDRLRIASEVAGALSYLHSAVSIQIVHRDVKSTNILLDVNLTAKVSDFGASRLVSVDNAGMASLVRGTFGYLDPEYLQTGQFTDKSDVYSFGVVLVELLTGQKPMEKTKFGNCNSLTNSFIMYLNAERLPEILEARVVNEGAPELLLGIAVLAYRCLSLKGGDRPSMKEVAMELEGLMKWRMHPWVFNEEERESLLGERQRNHSSSVARQCDSSMNAVVPFNITR